VKRHKQSRKWATTKLSVYGLSLLLPVLAAGCPEFRNQLVDATETAARNILLSEQECQETAEVAILDVASAVLDLFFDQFRTETTRF
jgi:hypothetical protein